MNVPAWIHCTAEVGAALDMRRPVVALESAVYSHGLPRGHARDLARRLEAVVRAAGAVPACVAVRSGQVVAGVREEEFDFLFAPGAAKVAERDLPVMMAQGGSGGTTVSATMAVAHAAGIQVVSTGGIGGVHVGADVTGDVSADLAALSRRPVAVVCAGPKAICDPSRTLEMLDSLGVTVIGYRTDTLPGFLARTTGIPVPHRMDTVDELAAVLHAKSAVGDSGALLVVQEPPRGTALGERELGRAVELAVARGHSAGIRSADLTPFLLTALAELTGGRSLSANLAVLEENARLGAAIAVAVGERAEISAP